MLLFFFTLFTEAVAVPEMLNIIAFIVIPLAVKTSYIDDLHDEQESEVELTGHEFVDYINEHQSLFRAEYSPDNERYVKARLMDRKYYSNKDIDKYPIKKIAVNIDLPERFDAREKWPFCPSIGHIRDQSACGSCWAVSAASVISDRLCIQSNGTKKTIISDTDILGCCGDPCGSGCYGGWTIDAFDYAKKNGVCSGGLYREKNVCKPYPFYSCTEPEKNYGPCPENGEPPFNTPKCRKMCQFNYLVPYEEDKVFVKSIRMIYLEDGLSRMLGFSKHIDVELFVGKSSYFLPKNETEIRYEIYTKGPVGARFAVFRDFTEYKNGIYKRKKGKFTGVHAVKIIGWGKENGTDFWLVANSYNKHWGENGYFRFIRGINHCGIEERVSALDVIV